MPNLGGMPAHQKLREYINSVRDLDASNGVVPQLNEMLAYAEGVAASVETLSGSCERGRPFAEIFLVIKADGSKVWRCTHDPRHPDIVA